MCIPPCLTFSSHTTLPENTHRDVLLLAIYSMEITRDVPKDMNLFVALVFMREVKRVKTPRNQ